MRKLASGLVILALTGVGFAGFKVKLIKPKKAEQFQTRSTESGVTFAADLLLDGREQQNYFYKELTPSRLIAVRLAVFNSGPGDLTLPVDAVELIVPGGRVLAVVAPEMAAQAVLQGMVVGAAPKDSKGPVAVPPNARAGDPRMDPRDPRLDPRVDPRDPRYDPTLDPNDPRYDPSDPRMRRDPRYDPSDPRSRDPRYDPSDPRTRDPRYDPGYPGGSPGGYPGQRRIGGYGGGYPGIILSPGGGGGVGDLSQFERTLVEKDFRDKAHAAEPLSRSLTRDRFLYFPAPEAGGRLHDYSLRIPAGPGIPHEVVLKF
jgi:hypothetical protein